MAPSGSGGVPGGSGGSEAGGEIPGGHKSILLQGSEKFPQLEGRTQTQGEVGRAFLFCFLLYLWGIV